MTSSAPNNRSRDGEICVITGGAQGIGFACAQQLGAEGAAVVVLIDMSDSALARARAQLESAGVRCATYVADVTDEEAVDRAFDSIAADYGGVTVLVTSAGITGKTNVKTHEVTAADFDRVIAVNTRGVFLCCRAALRHMVTKNYGRIVNIASIAGKEGNAGMLAYSTSKAAVIGLTKVIGKEYAAETGITCNALAPAVVRTEMVAALPDAQVAYMTDKIPMKRCGKLAEIANMVAFIASKEASFTTGFTFDATGGRATY